MSTESKAPVRRLTVSVPPELADRLDEISQFLRISRSSLVTAVLLPAVQQMSALLDAVEVKSDGTIDGRSFERAAYDRLAQLETMIQGVKDDVKELH